MRPFITNKKRIRKVAILAIWIGIWQMIYYIVGKDVLLPSPFTTFRTLLEMLQDFSVYKDILYTFYRVFMGILLSFMIGIGCAILSHRIEWIEAFLRPLITLLKTTPVMAFIMLALLWLKASTMPILVCFFMGYPIMYTEFLVGLENRDFRLIEMAKVYKVSKKEYILNLMVPSLLPSVYTALSLSFGLGWKAVVAAEVLAAPNYSMGYHLLMAKTYLETQSLFSWVIILVVLSAFVEKILKKVAKKEKS